MGKFQMKWFLSSLIIFCLGSFGILSGIFFIEYKTEIFLGMTMPLIVGILTVISTYKVYQKDPGKLTGWMIKSFFLKMIIYGLYFVIILGFYTFHALPFVSSFVGFFFVLHMIEALYFKKLFKNK